MVLRTADQWFLLWRAPQLCCYPCYCRVTSVLLPKAWEGQALARPAPNAPLLLLLLLRRLPPLLHQLSLLPSWPQSCSRCRRQPRWQPPAPPPLQRPPQLVPRQPPPPGPLLAQPAQTGSLPARLNLPGRVLPARRGWAGAAQGAQGPPPAPGAHPRAAPGLPPPALPPQAACQVPPQPPHLPPPLAQVRRPPPRRPRSAAPLWATPARPHQAAAAEGDKGGACASGTGSFDRFLLLPRLQQREQAPSCSQQRETAAAPPPPR